MIEKLERSTLPETSMDESLTKMRWDVGVKARDVLQYKGMDTTSPVVIEQALRDVGVAPFTLESVKMYQYKTVMAAQRSVIIRNFFCRDRGLAFLWITSILVFVSLILGVINGFYDHGPHLLKAVTEAFLQGWIFPVLLWIPLLLFSNHIRDTHGVDTVVSHKWASVPIKDYVQEIPEFALSTAIQLKEKLPNADFYVVELRQESILMRKPTPDPFLVMSCGSKLYYLHVWDEPMFEYRKKI